MKYGIIKLNSKLVDDGVYDPYTLNYEEIFEFNSQNDMLAWIKNNPTFKYRAIQFEELTIVHKADVK